MPIVVVTGPPFAGKGQFVRDEIARREMDGELGLISVDFTAIYSAITPGDQSSFRDEAVSDTGAPRLAGYAFAVLLTALLDRELSGYVSTPSPARALEIADKAGAPILDIAASVDQIATRITSHMRDLQRTVPAGDTRAYGWPLSKGGGGLSEKRACASRARSHGHARGQSVPDRRAQTALRPRGIRARTDGARSCRSRRTHRGRKPGSVTGRSFVRAGPERRIGAL